MDAAAEPARVHSAQRADPDKEAVEYHPSRAGLRERWAEHTRITRARHQQQVKDGVGHRFPRVRRLVLSQGFECFTAGLIIVNCISIGWQAEQFDPQGGVKIIMLLLEQLFTFAFSLELLLRVLCYGWTMLLDSDNWLDEFLVTLSILSTWILGPAQIEFDILRKLTVLRVLRLVRLARAVKHRPEFQEMWALLKGLTESGETLFWTYVMIGCVLYFFAIMATALIGKQAAFEDDLIAQEYLSTVPRSMLTLFQVMTLDSWTGIVRPLMEIQGWVIIFFMVFISISVFVLMNLITAVIVERAFESAKDDEADLAARMERKKEAELEDLKAFFESIDQDGNGKLTRSELMAATKQRKVRQKLRALEVMPKDVTELWEVLDNGDGELDSNEFVNGIRRLKGEARSKDILRLYRELRILEGAVEEIEVCLDASKVRMGAVQQQLVRAKADISAVQRTMGRAKDQVKCAARTQPLQGEIVLKD